MDEPQAIALLKRGDWSGLDLLVEKYYLQSVRAAALMIRDPVFAEDIVQSCFIQAAERIQQFDETRPFGPWFYRIVMNYTINWQKQQNRFVSIDTELSSQKQAEITEWLTSIEPDPEEMVVISELQQKVWDALEQLSPEQRAAIIMRYFLDLSENEMAHELDHPKSSIKWFLFSARKKLKSLLKLLLTDDSSTLYVHPLDRKE